MTKFRCAGCPHRPLEPTELTGEEFTAAAKAIVAIKRPWAAMDQLVVMTEVARDGRLANYGVKCPICKEPWLQYEYAYKPFDMEAYCHFCKSGMRQGNGLQGKLRGRAIICTDIERRQK